MCVRATRKILEKESNRNMANRLSGCCAIWWRGKHGLFVGLSQLLLLTPPPTFNFLATLR